jgi:repressor LexA
MGRPPGRKRTESDKRVYRFLEAFIQENGFPPTIREIAEGCKIPSTSHVDHILKKLAEFGMLARQKGVSRGLRLLKPAMPTLGTVRYIPLLGPVQAGLPILLPPTDFSFYDAESSIEIAASILPQSEELFALEVRGDSMIDANVSHGDIIVLQSAQTARNGEMVAALVNGETTLKFFYQEKGRVRLQPANQNYPPIMVEDPGALQIQGTVVLVMRKLVN